MFGDILGAILQPQRQVKLTANIIKQNELLEQELTVLNSELQNLPIEQMLIKMKNSPHAAAPSFVQEDRHIEIIRILQLFYASCGEEQKQGAKCQYLMQEIQIIKQLSEQLSLVETIALWNSFPEDDVLQFMKSLLSQLDDEIMSYRNKQNRNSFQAQEQQVCQHYSKVLAFLNKFKEIAEKVFRSVLTSTYSFQNGVCELNRQYFEKLWSQEKQYGDIFLKELQEYLSKFITYDINYRQYTLLIYETVQLQTQTKISQISKIMFQNHEISVHYESLTSTLKQLNKFITLLLEIIPKNRQKQVNQSLKKIVLNIKQYFEFLVPYLKMEMRKQLWSLMPYGQAGSQSSIYDLLVSVKMKGQDANSMVETINLIVGKMVTNNENTRIVLDFIELAKGSPKNYNTVMFLCDQLVEGLENSSTSIDPHKLKTIRQLLAIRQEMRLKIHNVQD